MLKRAVAALAVLLMWANVGHAAQKCETSIFQYGACTVEVYTCSDKSHEFSALTYTCRDGWYDLGKNRLCYVTYVNGKEVDKTCCTYDDPSKGCQ